MKNANLSGNALNRLFKPAVLSLLALCLLSTAPAQANGGDNPKNFPAEVKYVGTSNGQPLFQIAINNPQSEEVFLTLRDENGALIYSDTFKEKTYSRKLRFDNLDADKLKVNLSLRTKKDVQTQSFEITRSLRTIEDVAVVSL
jgi:hypothetical protein